MQVLAGFSFSIYAGATHNTAAKQENKAFRLAGNVITGNVPLLLNDLQRHALRLTWSKISGVVDVIYL